MTHKTFFSRNVFFIEDVFPFEQALDYSYSPSLAFIFFPSNSDSTCPVTISPSSFTSLHDSSDVLTSNVVV